MKYFFETYGCQMNIAESAALALAARERGWAEAQGFDEADLVLLNTCSVRATAEQRVKGRLAHYAAIKKKGGKPFTLVMAGCMAERIGDKLKKDYPALDYIIGTSARSVFPMILKALEQGRPYFETAEKPEFSFSAFHFDGGGAEQSPFRSFVPIMHGCNNFCSYCIVPYVRGREVSRDPAAILEEIRLLGGRGVRELTLLGQNVNSYMWPKTNVDFPGLLEMIARETENSPVRRIRFLSSHPKDLSLEAVRVMAAYPCFCRHLHLCAQHGSNRILSAMNRRYTREQYLELAARLRGAMPDISLSTDILVGFPGETEEDFEETLSLMEEVKFLYAYMYHYNPREGTAAYALPGRISEENKKKRLSRVIALQKKHTNELLKSRIGQRAKVLIEGISRKNADELVTRTERDEMAVVPGPAGALGTFAELTLSSLKGNTFRSHFFDILD
ncbi:MAG: tRNA (N6-isopentenyl adenosine(37)-C2)-methylthiotransferase MiaB [Treponema sp.]|jgi:tRNA-2-methylthio-N6-dimethylallyladenosine synthase|nr:tRNA (N6-isopentenyl adenosine(37)-C2)-methylthiotransferase MiaB [Treponema sp.]